MNPSYLYESIISPVPLICKHNAVRFVNIRTTCGADHNPAFKKNNFPQKSMLLNVVFSADKAAVGDVVLYQNNGTNHFVLASKLAEFYVCISCV
jgi:hypothetical protein